MLKRVMIVGLLSFMGHIAVAEQMTPQKYADIKRLMTVTGSANVAMQQIASVINQQLFQSFKATNPGIHEHSWDLIQRELLAYFSKEMKAPGGLMDQFIPVYAKYFTDQEILELLAFYQTPIGRKTILVLPKVANDSAEISQRWGQSLGPEIRMRLKTALSKRGEDLSLGHDR